ncbi:E3 ubiquitin-protein ligase RBBP6 isoform X2 [Atheta coriaria]|uniref:E3 ubiquitin-protein ligase RBBP6 isoform X2 n=1 Tax=Dalotia coriaria TaxID=877792 RepID=UPI0031F3EC80
MSVHYKFKSALEYDTVTFDGLHISVKDLKIAIIQQKRIGKNTDFDLQVTNAQTKQIYEDEQSLIPKNTSLLIARVPQAAQTKAKTWEGYGHETVQSSRQDDGGPIAKAMDLASLDASESDKILAMMSQSTQDYDPSNYVKIRGSNQVGQVPHNYRCYKCHQAGHWIKDCPLSQSGDTIDIKKSTGIPRSFMVEVEGPQVQGAMMTPYGSFAVPALDHQTYTQKNQPAPAPLPVQKTDIPEDLVCSICSDLLTDAVMIPCCGNSFCDECIRSSLLESEEHECPDCHDRDISPGTLIPNRFLRNSVTNFKSTTGYVKRQIYKPAVIGQNSNRNVRETGKNGKVKDEPVEKVSESVEVNSQLAATANDDTADSTEKTIISEADSTETPKTPLSDGTKEPPPTKTVTVNHALSELPPGVSPTPEKSPDVSPNLNSKPIAEKSLPSPRDTSRPAPVETEERSGTPTVDEPGAPPAAAPPPFVNMINGGDNFSPYSVPPPIDLPQHPIPAMHSASLPLQGYDQPPRVNMHYNQPPMSHYPPPNYRIPPPGQHNYMYNPPPRNNMYDIPHTAQHGMPPQENYYPNNNRARPREYPVRPINVRTPPGIIDDPLEAFNRMLAEKDERERRAKANRKGRSYSRSSSRSFSRSPLPRRRSSRSPRRRSRSNSFSISRSRSRSYSSNHRTSPYRDYSPRRRVNSRYRTSPQTSPSRYRYRDAPDRERERDRERDRERRYNSRERERAADIRPRERERERGRENDYGPPRMDMESRDYSQRPQSLLGVGPGPGSGPPDGYNYYNNNYDRGEQSRPGGPKWLQGAGRHEYYLPHSHPPAHQIHHSDQQISPYHQHHSSGNAPPPMSNRYPSHDYPQNNQNPPPLMSNVFPAEIGPPSLLQQQPFNDVLPPGIDQPLPPGEDLPPRYGGHVRPPADHSENSNAPGDGRSVDRGRERERDRERQDIHPHVPRDKERDRDRDRERDRRGHSRDREQRDRGRTGERERDRGRDRESTNDKSKERHNSRSPSRQASSSQKRKSRNDSPKNSDDKKKDKDKDKDKGKEKERATSDEEKSKKYKDKKKKREKKDSDKKKKKDKKDKKDQHKKEEREQRKEEKGKDRDKPKDGSAVVEQQLTNSMSAPETTAVPSSSAEEPKLLPMIQSSQKEENSTLLLDCSDIPLQDHLDLLRADDSSIPYEPVPADEVRTRTSISPVEINPCKVTTPELLTNPPKPDEDVLELYTGELKSELDKEMLAPLPEPSKWEVDDDHSQNSATENEATFDKSKVTQDVLKRAENAIFAKAINAIRPIEIKKISGDRAKLYSGEKDKEEVSPSMKEENNPKEKLKEQDSEKDQPKPPPARLSVKERLGHKVDDLERIVRIGHKEPHRSRTISPNSKRALENKERRITEVDTRAGRRGGGGVDDRSRERERDRDRRDRGRGDRREGRRSSRDREAEYRKDDKLNMGNKERIRNRLGEREDIRDRGPGPSVNRSTSDKRKRSRSNSASFSKDRKEERHRKKEKKTKRDKDKEGTREADKERERTRDRERDRRKRKETEIGPPTKDKPMEEMKHNENRTMVMNGEIVGPSHAVLPPEITRKDILNEQDFVPDYDAESEHEQAPQSLEESKKPDSPAKKKRTESLSNSSSDSSSDDERKRKNDSSSSDDDKEKTANKRRKHKKKKKKKKSKHKS